jgi:hypothetical protein
MRKRYQSFLSKLSTHGDGSSRFRSTSLPSSISDALHSIGSKFSTTTPSTKSRSDTEQIGLGIDLDGESAGLPMMMPKGLVNRLRGWSKRRHPGSDNSFNAARRPDRRRSRSGSASASYGFANSERSKIPLLDADRSLGTSQDLNLNFVLEDRSPLDRLINDLNLPADAPNDLLKPNPKDSRVSTSSNLSSYCDHSCIELKQARTITIKRSTVRLKDLSAVLPPQIASQERIMDRKRGVPRSDDNGKGGITSPFLHSRQ